MQILLQHFKSKSKPSEISSASLKVRDGRKSLCMLISLKVVIEGSFWLLVYMGKYKRAE